MNKEHNIILEKLRIFLEQNPTQRFGQAIFNLGINEFKENEEFQLRDIYNDPDSEIIDRIENNLNWFELQRKVQFAISKTEGIEGMTVNERLYVSGLMEIFDNVKNTNKKHAHYILESLKVDEESISKILN